jgi:hypothetical protein
MGHPSGAVKLPESRRHLPLGRAYEWVRTQVGEGTPWLSVSCETPTADALCPTDAALIA